MRFSRNAPLAFAGSEAHGARVLRHQPGACLSKRRLFSQNMPQKTGVLLQSKKKEVSLTK